MLIYLNVIDVKRIFKEKLYGNMVKCGKEKFSKIKYFLKTSNYIHN